MKLLLDTNALIWLLEGDGKLGLKAREAITADGNTVFVSAVSLYEMAVKIRIGKLSMDLAEAMARIAETDVERLGLEDRHCQAMASMIAAPGHRDPFDLMLVAQALSDNLILVSADSMMGHYPITVISAR